MADIVVCYFILCYFYVMKLPSLFLMGIPIALGLNPTGLIVLTIFQTTYFPHHQAEWRNVENLPIITTGDVKERSGKLLSVEEGVGHN